MKNQTQIQTLYVFIGAVQVGEKTPQNTHTCMPLSAQNNAICLKKKKKSGIKTHFVVSYFHGRLNVSCECGDYIEEAEKKRSTIQRGALLLSRSLSLYVHNARATDIVTVPHGSWDSNCVVH